MKRVVAACVIVGAAVLLSGCHTEQPVAVPTNPNDLGGVHMSVEDQIKALEANTTMPEAYKQRRLAMLRSKLNGAGAEEGPPGRMNRR